VSAVKLYTDRAWALPAVFAIVGLSAAIAGSVVVAGELRGVSIHGAAMAGGVIATMFGGLFGYLGVAGVREGGAYVVIDPAARTLRFHRGRNVDTYRLDDLSALYVIQSHQDPPTGRRGPRLVIWELRADPIPRPLFQSARRDLVDRRKARIETLVVTSAGP
jgi:hypothetical protein